MRHICLLVRRHMCLFRNRGANGMRWPRTGEGLRVEELEVDVWSQAAHHAASLFWALHRDVLSQDASGGELPSWEVEELLPWEEE